MAISIKESLKMEKLMDMEYKRGQMEKNMMDNGKWALEKVMAYGQELKIIILILESGIKIKLKVMELTPGLMVSNYKMNSHFLLGDRYDGEWS